MKCLKSANYRCNVRHGIELVRHTPQLVKMLWISCHLLNYVTNFYDEIYKNSHMAFLIKWCKADICDKSQCHDQRQIIRNVLWIIIDAT